MSKLKDLSEVEKIVSEHGMKLVKYENNKNVYVICSCGNENYKTTTIDIKKGKKCMKCKSKRTKEKNEEKKEKIEDSDNEKWVKYFDRFISSKGKVKNEIGVELTINEQKKRTSINGRAEYISIAMAKAFKIDNYDKLDDKIDGKTYVVSFIDGNNKNIILNNLVVLSKSASQSKSRVGDKSHSSDKFKEYMNIKIDDLEKIESKKVSFMPDHTFYSNGIITNKNRALTGSNNPDGYISLNTSEKSYKYHRIMCIAFYPIEGKNTYEDYKDIQVNHKDGDKQNNKPDNLEWVSQSENISHAIYNIKGNKKGRSISQYDPKTKEKINSFKSIALAFRTTGIKEHTIRETAKLKRNIVDGDYIWKYDNEDETEEYKEKYSKHCIKKV